MRPYNNQIFGEKQPIIMAKVAPIIFKKKKKKKNSKYRPFSSTLRPKTDT